MREAIKDVLKHYACDVIPLLNLGEREKVREKIGKAFCRILSKEIRFRDSKGVWQPMEGLVREMSDLLLDEVFCAKDEQGSR